jgi:hypothetical protein
VAAPKVQGPGAAEPVTENPIPANQEKRVGAREAREVPALALERAVERAVEGRVSVVL